MGNPWGNGQRGKGERSINDGKMMHNTNKSDFKFNNI
jgi:hypothetical protein